MGFTASEIAEQAGVDGKTFRSFVRRQASHANAIVSACGQGNRYDFSADEALALLDAFATQGNVKHSQPKRSAESVADLLEAHEAQRSADIILDEDGV
jgi:hypothetical protein